MGVTSVGEEEEASPGKGWVLARDCIYVKKQELSAKLLSVHLLGEHGGASNLDETYNLLCTLICSGKGTQSAEEKGTQPDKGKKRPAELVIKWEDYHMALAWLLSWPFHDEDPDTTMADHDRMVRVTPMAIYYLEHTIA